MSRRAYQYLAAALAALALSWMLVAYFFYSRALDYYAREQWVRLDPTSERAMRAREIPPVPEGNSTVVFFGDSRIAQWSQLPAPQGVVSINRGRGGDTTAQALLRLKRDVIELKPDLVVVQLGINDLKVIGVSPKSAKRITEGCLDNLRRIAMKLRDANIPVLWTPVLAVGPVPLTRTPIWSDQTLKAIQKVNSTLPALVKVPKLSDVTPLESNGRMKPSFALDEFHLTADGYDAWSQLLLPEISLLLNGTH